MLYYIASLIRDLDVNDESLITNDERMTNARSSKDLPLSEFLGTDISSFHHSTLGNSLDIQISTFVISPVLL